MAGSGRTLKIVLTGVLTLLMGLQFAAGALSARLASGRRTGGIVLAAILILVMYFLGGLQVSLMTAACAAALVTASAMKLSIQSAAALAAGIGTIAAVAGLVEGPGLMAIQRRELDSLLPEWAGEELGPGGRTYVLDAAAYLSPGLGAVQTAAGSALAAALFGMTGGFATIRREDLRLGLGTAWILIASLAAAIVPTQIPPEARAFAHNSLLFIAVPYFAVGAAVAGEAMRGMPGLLLPFVLLVVFATPLSVAAVTMTGVLDTWFDFRRRIRSKPGSDPK